MSATPPLAPTTQELEKQQAAAAAVRWVREGMVLGLGTGTTSAQFIIQLGALVQAGLKVQGTATSLASEALAEHRRGPTPSSLKPLPAHHLRQSKTPPQADPQAAENP